MFFFSAFDLYKMNRLKVAYGQYSVVYVKNMSDKNFMTYNNFRFVSQYILFSFPFDLYKMNRLKVAYGQYSVVYVKKHK